MLILSQIVHALQLEIAGLAAVDPFDVSLQLITEYIPRLMQQGQDPVTRLVTKGEKFGFICPSRRIRPETPPVDMSQLVPLPPDTILQRKPRYAQRRCNRQTDIETFNKASPPLTITSFPDH